MDMLLLSTFDDLLHLENDWNSLLTKSETNTIFLTHEWITNWWKCFGQDKELFVLLVRHGQKILGIAPLMIAPSKVFIAKLKRIQFIGTPHSDYCDFIVGEQKEAVLEALYEYLIQRKKRWNEINLVNVPGTSSTLLLSRKILKKLRARFNMLSADECPSISLSSEAVQQIQKKRDIIRHCKYLSERGELTFSNVKDVGQASGLLGTLFQQHLKIFQTKGISSSFSDAKWKRLLLSLINELLPKGRIDLWALIFKKEPIAIVYGFKHDKKYLTYCQSYDPQYSRYGPGMILFKHFIDQYFQAGLDEVDFGRGGELYKHRFSNKRVYNFDIRVEKSYIHYLLVNIYFKTKEIVMKDRRLAGLISEYKSKLQYENRSFTQQSNRTKCEILAPGGSQGTV